jgi:Aldehyde dehydrogenase family
MIAMVYSPNCDQGSIGEYLAGRLEERSPGGDKIATIVFRSDEPTAVALVRDQGGGVIYDGALSTRSRAPETTQLGICGSSSPSEVAPLNVIIWSEVMHAAAVPKGVYNMVQGEGGEAMSAHPGIDMMSFTGSTRAGILAAQAAARTTSASSRNSAASQPTS